MANIASQKRMAAEILKCGRSRIKISAAKDVEEALTREDVRNLIRKGIIKKVQKKGTSRAAARKKLIQKKKGRRKGMGSRKGSSRAGTSRKELWMKKVKTMRRFIKDLRDSGRMEKKDYRKLYMRVKGGMFRNKKHITLYIKEHELLKKPTKTVTAKKAKPAKKPAKSKASKKPAKKTAKPAGKAKK